MSQNQISEIENIVDILEIIPSLADVTIYDKKILKETLYKLQQEIIIEPELTIKTIDKMKLIIDESIENDLNNKI